MLASVRRIFTENACLALLYYLSGQLGRLAAPPHGVATVVWPPSGIALAALLILGNRVWPGIWVGAFLANNWAALQYTSTFNALSFLATGMGIDTGSLLQALAGATLCRTLIGNRNPFDSVKHSLTFVGIALSMCLVASTIGVLSLCLGGALPWEAALARWGTWWIGDSGGVLVVTPLILTIWHLGWPQWDHKRRAEAAVLLFISSFFAVAVFILWRPSAELRYPADLVLLPLIAWVAYRFTQREVSVLVALVLTIAITGALHGRGPYQGISPWSSLPVVQFFIGILSILSIIIGAVIAERKTAGEALEASEHWLRESQRISRIGTYVLDVRTGEWTRSEVLEEILGITPDYPCTQEAWLALLHAEDRPGVLEQLKDVTAVGREFRREVRMVRPRDGSVRWVSCSGEVSLDARKAPAKLSGTVLDITERKNIEAQLLQSQKMESIGRLAGGVAHDFNNLLMVINGYAEMALRRISTNDQLYTEIREICRAGDQAAELTRQLLAFSRKQVLRPQVLSLNDIVRDSDTMLRRLIGEDIALVCILDPSLRPVEADPGQISQVIVNLAVNARDAMPSGGKLIIETANSDQGVSLTVSDTGHGMGADTLEHVFEPFFTTKGVGKGTGLGLATVYGIVRQSAGDITVESESGIGTKFAIHLPAVEGFAARKDDAQPLPRASGTVLLVEDEDAVRGLIAAVLEQQGCRVLVANDGEDALRLYGDGRHHIDLLITDVVMPHMRGTELAIYLRQVYPKLSVLFTSGYTDPSISTQVAEAGSCFLQKPFKADDLLRAANAALGQ